MGTVEPTLIDIRISSSLRLIVWPWLSRVFLIHCWVMVDPDWTSPPFAMSYTARRMPCGSTPLSVQKVAFSAARKSFWTSVGTAVSGTFCRK